MSPSTRHPLSIEYALLGLLRSGPQHGYSLYQNLSGANGPGLVCRIQQSHFYAMLNRLEEAGYVTSTIQSQQGHPPRRVYQLTQMGIYFYLNWIIRPAQSMREIRQVFMTRFYFARIEGKNYLEKLITQQKVVCQRWMATLEKQAQKENDLRSFASSVYHFRIGQIEAVLKWLEEIQG